MSDTAQRLQQARKNAGFTSAAEAAERFGWAKPTYSGHENGSRGVRRDKAEQYGRAFKVSPEWLLFGGSDDASTAPPPALPAELVSVYDVKASAGDGALVEDERVIEQLAFPAGYLSRITKAKPKDLAIIGVKGDSMAPTIDDDDVVMIDVAKRDLSFDGLFVIKDGGASLLVKRIGRGGRSGHIMVISDNPTYPNTERAVEDIEVVGKVVWYGRKV